ncbi:phosphate/phosphite/phosphonate ABC transporter substrate-binding protein [Thiobacter aerophilum]|uniref:PhnD/SsuA/transferrin family substrate-binding protein n=1 Tax=Thiobacter aerophilum TaxID=3121275 RepID=A0ABV0EEQ4_9BURK
MRRFWAAIFFLALATSHAAEYRPTPVNPGGGRAQATYVFGFHPHLNPQELVAAYQPILDYLEQHIPNVKFQLEGAKDYSEFEARLVARRYHFALPNPVQTLIAQRVGYHVIAKNFPDEDFRGALVTREGRITGLRQLSGETLCFPSATAVAATLLPLWYLHRHGVDVKSLRLQYTGTQVAALLNAGAGDAAACGVSVRFLRAFQRDEPNKAARLAVLFVTDPSPHNAIVARADVPAALKEKVAATLAAMAADPTVDASRFKLGQHRFERASDETYRPFRAFLERYDAEIGLPAALKPVIAR